MSWNPRDPGGWKGRHTAALYNPQGVEVIVRLLDAADAYAIAYLAHFGSTIGTDAELGDRGLAEILRGVEMLLNGPLGRLDGGELSHWIEDIRIRHGLEEE